MSWPLLLLQACTPHEAPPKAPASAAAPVKAQALAHLERVVRDVRVRPRGDASDVVGVADTQLNDGDLVLTGANGEVDVVFAGNNRVHLQANSAMLLHGTDATATQVGAVVLRGAVKATAGGRGVGLDIGSPLGVAKMGGDSLAVLNVDLGKGLHLETGEVVLARPDRLEVLPLQLGQTLTLDALPLLLPSQQGLEVDGITVQNLAPPAAPSLPAHVALRRGQAQKQGRGLSGWTQLNSGELLQPGDRLRLGQGDSAQVVLADGMDVDVGDGSEIVFEHTQDTPSGRRSRYSLHGGSAQLHITSLEGRPGQEVDVAGAALQVAPGVKEAKVDITHGAPGEAHVVVRRGNVTVGAQKLEAGEATDVRNGAVKAPYPAFYAPITLRPGRPTTVFVARDVPAFRFGDDAAHDHQIALASRGDMAAPHTVEKTERAAYATDEVPMGTTYWRQGAGDAAPNTLEVRREASRKCDACVRHELVDDARGDSVLVYQSKVPTTTLRWSAVAEATNYRVTLRSAAPDAAPLWQKTVQQTQVTLPAKVLDEGDYVWSVVPLGQNDETLSGEKSNVLRLRFDNVVKGLRLETPSEGSSVATRSVVSQGVVEPGSSLFINDRPVRLDTSGRFRSDIALRRGANRLVYNVVAKDGSRRIYVRTLRRTSVAKNAAVAHKKRRTGV